MIHTFDSKSLWIILWLNRDINQKGIIFDYLNIILLLQHSIRLIYVVRYIIACFILPVIPILCFLTSRTSSATLPNKYSSLPFQNAINLRSNLIYYNCVNNCMMRLLSRWRISGTGAIHYCIYYWEQSRRISH